MRTKLWLVLPLALASIALAQNAGVQGARGEGAARSEDGRVGKFRFEVKKSQRPGGEPVVGGNMRFESEPPTREGRHVLIEGRALRYAGRENVAEFGGPGIIVIRSGEHHVRHEGHWMSRVVDNRRPEAVRLRPDQFRIRFEVANSDVFYEFEGAVLRGDLAVHNR